jgi:hypothetical protein
MKKNLLLILLMSFGLFLCSNAIAQDAPDWASVIKATRGDTLVIKSTTESEFFNTIRTAVMGDPDRANPKRVYETVPGEYYISDVSLDLDASIPNFVLTAPKPAPGVTPPIHVRALKPDAKKDKTFTSCVNNMYVENQYYCGTFLDDSYESEFNRASLNSRVIVNNCIFELSRWVGCIPVAKHVTYKFTNCKFINYGHEATIEKGLVIETRTLPPDTIWMENNTIINCGGFIMSLENSAPTFGYFSHNTVVNTTQGPFIFHSAAEVVVANNLFVNSGLVPDYPGFYPLFDDDDHMPKGLINVDTCEVAWQNNYWGGDSVNGVATTIYPVTEANRKFLFDRNSAWWDPRFDDMVKNKMTPIDPAVLPDGKWASQMMLMNSRTKAMFDDNTAYPYLNEGTTLNINPDFKNNKDLVSEWIQFVVSNVVAGAPNKGGFQPTWRTSYPTELYKIDWPILADLTYTDATLKGAGLNGFPLGDLNWFPAEKASWEATNESKTLIAAMKSGKLATSAITGMSVSPNTETINIDKEIQLNATITPADANQNVTWKSDNPAVATVSATGKVKGISIGSATITVTTEDGSKTATCIVYVTFKASANFNKNNSFDVFPNPIDGSAKVAFRISESSNVEICVYNMLGEKVRVMQLGKKEAGNHQVIFEKGDLGQGLYFMNLKTDTGILQSKKVSIK